MFKIMRNCLRWTTRRLNIVAHLTAENVALRQQVIVLMRAQKRPKLMPRDLIRARRWVSPMPGKEPTRDQRQDDELQPFHTRKSSRSQESPKVPATIEDSSPDIFPRTQGLAQLRGNLTDPIHGRYVSGTFRCSRFAAYPLNGKSLAAG